MDDLEQDDDYVSWGDMFEVMELSDVLDESFDFWHD